MRKFLHTAILLLFWGSTGHTLLLLTEHGPGANSRGRDCSSSPTESTGGDLRRCYPSGLMSGAFQQQELYLAAS